MNESQIKNAYKYAILEDINVEYAPLGSICGIYKAVDNEYFVFLDARLTEESNHTTIDTVMYILTNHHNSRKRGETKVITYQDLNFFKRVFDEVKRFEQSAIDAVLRAINAFTSRTPSSTIGNQ